MSDEEIFYTMALTRMTGFSTMMALQLYQAMGGGKAVYEQRDSLGDVMPDGSPRLIEALRNWDDALKRAAAEMDFIARHHIQALTLNDQAYPARLRHCQDAPVIVYYRGSADLNRRRVVDIVGTRHCTNYGQDLVRRFIERLHELCPDVLIVSGLAYGIDICAHRQALAIGYDTVAVVAHGLDTIYPSHHRETARQMVSQGGLLTEYMSQTEPFANNFRQRNRIVAGMSDATILVESAIKGGGLITCRVAQEYGREVFAFPGAVGMVYSEGCNRMIRNNTAALITTADDVVEAMGWQVRQQRTETVERQLFPELSAQEQQIVTQLQLAGDLQLNVLSVKAGIPIGQLTALLFQLEMKGIVRPLAGGTYHLLY